jgi:AcrR family transcriptional regulator
MNFITTNTCRIITVKIRTESLILTKATPTGLSLIQTCERTFVHILERNDIALVILMIGNGTERSEDTRKRIIESAYDLFVSSGYHGTSMRNIAQDAGLSSVAGIYNHFVSKERVFARVVETYHPLVRVMESTENARGRTQHGLLKSMAKNMIESLWDDPGMLNLMLIEFVEHRGAHIEELRSVFLPQLMETAKKIRSKKGRLRRIDPETLSQSLLGFVFSQVFFGWVFDSTEQRDAKKLRRHLRLYLNGVLLPRKKK